MRLRRGFSLLELMAVIVLAAVIAMVAVPKVRAVQRGAGINSAKLQLRTYLAAARATAVRRGGTARLVRTGNVLVVTVDSSATQAVVIRPFDFNRNYSVLLSGTVDSVVYGARGLATNLGTTGEKFYIVADSIRVGRGRDSVCLTRLGLVLETGCGI
jgi:prepilin-type N-terminal cleavage/methylation domain-containing protein